MSHSRLSPSSASRWITCSASIGAVEEDLRTGVLVKEVRSKDEVNNPAAHWGTQAHLIGEMMLLDAPTSEIKKALPKKFRTDKACWDCATDYVKYVQNLVRPGTEMLVEHRVNLSEWLPDALNDEGELENQGGTADCILVHTDGTVDMIDLKGGMGMVFAEENPQLKIYSGGIIDELECVMDVKKIRTHIVQPRRDHYDVAEYTSEYILDFMTDEVSRAAQDITNNKGSFVPSESACQWCPRAGYCEAQTDKVMVDIAKDIDDLESEEAIADPKDLTVKQLIKVQSKAKEIKAFLASVETRIFERLSAGTKTTGFKLVEANTNRKWASSDDKLAEVLAGMGLEEDDIWSSKIGTISAIEKLIDSKQKKQLAAHITKPQGKPTLAPMSDKRPALKPMLTTEEMMEIEDNG